MMKKLLKIKVTDDLPFRPGATFFLAAYPERTLCKTVRS